ncbi:MAG TPA: biopolymer transporter TolR [Opitutaceae bacterium]|nr:biopolymer transporter TolR [Opitutaceae bacterium]
MTPLSSRVFSVSFFFARWTRGFFRGAMACGLAAAALAASDDRGDFTDHTDIGVIKHPGTVAFDAARRAYTVGGSGVNMWAREDAFHFVWKKISGDIALAADIAFVGASAEPHRKACLIIRESLDADSVYVDAALHGDGLTSLQFRDAKGGVTREVQTNRSSPRRLRLEKIGDTVYLSLAGADGELAPSGCSVRVPFTGEFYIGLAVCAHNANAFEQAVFSNVEFSPPSKSVTAVRSSLETIVIASQDRRSVYHTNELIEAPNWTRDGTALYFNGGGRIYRLPLAGVAQPERIDTGFAVKCNNDHGLSPDGTQLVISDQTKDNRSRIYVLPATGGTPREVTPAAPSYWHGWSPDGQTLAYCAQRDGKYGIFTVPVAGGGERRLTITDGLDDGPDYSPDGKWIYFNSDRSGRMQIWRMHADGTAMEQVTKDEFNNWFPHPSPNGRWIAFLSYAPDVKGHPADKDVTLRLMPAAGGEATVLVKLFGGQGTINVPSWSPDSRQLAYVRYQPLVKK